MGKDYGDPGWPSHKNSPLSPIVIVQGKHRIRVALLLDWLSSKARPIYSAILPIAGGEQMHSYLSQEH